MQRFKKINLMILVVALFIGGAILTGCSCSNSPQLFTRAATNNDVYIDLSEELSLNVTYKVTPNVDIDNLEITFKYYDNNKKLLATKYRTLGNVKKGVQYSVYVSFGEFSLWDLFKITSTSARVTSGSVSYFA